MVEDRERQPLSCSTQYDQADLFRVALLAPHGDGPRKGGLKTPPSLEPTPARKLHLEGRPLIAVEIRVTNNKSLF